MTSSFDDNAPLIMGKPSTMNDKWQLNLYKLLHRASQIQPNSEILTVINNGNDMHRITYRQFDKLCSNLASSLKSKLSLNIGDCCGSFMYNNCRHLSLYFTIPCMGSILNTLNIRLHPNELSYLIKHAENKIIFVDYDLLSIFTQIPIETFINVKYIIICGPNELPLTSLHHQYIQNMPFFKSLPSTTKYIDYNFLISNNNSQPFIWPNLDEKSGCFLCYTSGTTGNPKGVLFSHRSLFLHILGELSTDNLNISGIDIALPIVPLYHALGWLFPFTSLCLGYTFILLNQCNKYQQILPICKKYNVSIIAGVPTVIQSFKNTIIKLNINGVYDKYLTNVLKRGLCGGSACSPSMINWFWNKYKIELATGWGMTEMAGPGTTSRMNMTQLDNNKTNTDKLKNLYTVGLPAPLLKLKIDSDDKKMMGELMANGPYVTSKYYKTETPNKFDKNGWLITGDVAEMTNDNKLIIRDRSKDVIKSGGEWISSIDMENYIQSYDVNNIIKCVVIGVKHEKFDERPIVIMEVNDNKKLSKREIMDYLKLKYANFQLPDDILFWDNIPVAGTGKISKKNIRDLLKKQKYKLPKVALRKLFYGSKL